MVAAENQRPVSIEIATAKGFTRPPLHDFFMTRYVAAYANEIAAFIAAVNDRKPAKPDGADGLAALLLAEAALRSVAEKRTVLVKESRGLVRRPASSATRARARCGTSTCAPGRP
jgi:myo-inositol 2-dehydrogenase/D-chiro-inositol 1-dehydrogenase